MSVKNQKKYFAVLLALGVVFFVAALFVTDDYRSGILSSMSASALVISLVRFLRIYRLEKDPDRKADYEASQKDERIAYIANKARSMTFVISIYGQLAVGLVALFGFKQHTLGVALCYLVCIQCLLFAVIYRIYSRKY